MCNQRLNELEKRTVAIMLGLSVYDIDLTPTSFILNRYDLNTQLKKNANRDFEAYKRELYAELAAKYREQITAPSYTVAGLFSRFDGFRKWLKSGEQTVPANYEDFGSFQVRRDVRGTMKQEWMVVLPACVFGLHVIISLDTVIDLLRVLKQQKISTVNVRAVPITPRIHPTSKSYIEETYHWSALEIQHGRDVYQIYSATKPDMLIHPML